MLVASPALFLEHEAVLKWEDHGLPASLVEGFLAELAQCISPVELPFVWRPRLRDADGELVLEAAMDGQAEAIVTHNEKEFAKATDRFGMEVLSSAKLIGRLTGRARKAWHGYSIDRIRLESVLRGWRVKMVFPWMFV